MLVKFPTNNSKYFPTLHFSALLFILQSSNCKEPTVFPWPQKLEKHQVMWTAVGSWCNFSIACSHLTFHHWSNTFLYYTLYGTDPSSVWCFIIPLFLKQEFARTNKSVGQYSTSQFGFLQPSWSAVSFCAVGINPSVIIGTACSSRFLLHDVGHLASTSPFLGWYCWCTSCNNSFI